MTWVHLGIGSNLGDSKEAIHCACRSSFGLAESTVVRVSSLYETAPCGDPRMPAFLNAACVLETALPPGALLEGLQRLEVSMGRVPPGDPGRSGPRPLDVDILSYGEQVIKSPTLQVPHASLAFRSFVLVPLSEIDAFWNHPVLKKNPGQLLSALAPVYDVRWVGHPPWKES